MKKPGFNSVLVLATIGAIASLPEVQNSLNLKDLNNQDLNNKDLNNQDLNNKDVNNQSTNNLISTNFNDKIDKIENIDALKTLLAKKAATINLSSSIDIIASAYSDSGTVLADLNNNNKTLKKQYFDNLILAGTGTADSATAAPVTLSSLAAPSTLSCHAACHSACHGACHGSRSWR